MLLSGGGMAMADAYQENMQGFVQICSCVCVGPMNTSQLFRE